MIKTNINQSKRKSQMNHNYQPPHQPPILRQSLNPPNNYAGRQTLPEKPNHYSPHVTQSYNFNGNQPPLSINGDYSHFDNRLNPSVSGDFRNPSTLLQSFRRQSPNQSYGDKYFPNDKLMDKSRSRDQINKSSSVEKFAIKKNMSLAQPKIQQFPNLTLINQQIIRLSSRLENAEAKIQSLEQAKGSNLQKSTYSDEVKKLMEIMQKNDDQLTDGKYKKVMSQIQQLQGNIVQCFSEVKRVKSHSSMDYQSEQIKKLEALVLEQVSQLSGQIKKQIADNNRTFEKEILIKTLIKTREIIENYQQNDVQGTLPKRSTKQFEGQMITLHYEQKLFFNKEEEITNEANSNFETAIITSKKYFIDPHGYLLDKNKFYLVNKSDNPIKLTNKEMDILRKFNMIGK